MDINDIKNEYKRLDSLTGIDSGIIEIRISSRMTRKLGCFSVAGSKLSIAISDKVLSDDALCLDVIRHEYAHALVYLRHPKEKHGHDSVWKAACKEVGCMPKASVKLDGTPEGLRGSRKREYKYLVKCLGCGAESKYKSMATVVKIVAGFVPGTVVCRKCGGKRFTVRNL